MAQDRMIRASMRTSEKVNSWPIPLRFFWTQLWGFCDDHGRGRHEPRLIVADAFPMDDEVTTEVVSRWMQALELAGVIRVYEVGGKRYFECVNWDEHQEPPYYKKTDVPDPSGVIPEPSKRSKKVLEDSGNVSPNRRGIEGEVEGEGESAQRPPVDNSDPSPFCRKHPQGTTKNCRPCADARRAHQAWLRKRADKPATLPPRTDETPAHDHRWVAGGTCMFPGCIERKATA